jgi:hypothetical protein
VVTKRSLLETIEFGSAVAEQEANRLGQYFVETYQWKKIAKGEVDIVFGKKGTGKSAIYSLIQGTNSSFFDNNILITAAENPQGDPAFSLFLDEKISAPRDCTHIWKLYLLSLIANTICEYQLETPEFEEVKEILQSAGLIEKTISLRTLLRRAYDYVKSWGRIESIEPGIRFDPNTGMPTGFTGRITFKEPSSEERKTGKVPVDELIGTCEAALGRHRQEIWVLIDRLDVIFEGNQEIERMALRALFDVYKDFLSVRPKTF